MKNRGRVENLKPWTKGQPSPNSKGRPRKSAITEAIKELLGAECPEDKLGRSYAEVIALAVVRRASKGDIRAAAEIADRTEGKPIQAHLIGESIDENTARRLADLVERLMPELSPPKIIEAEPIGLLLAAEASLDSRDSVK